MGKALSITWRGIVDAYNEMFPMVGMNLIWFGLNVVLGLVFSPLLLLGGLVGVPPELSSVALLFVMVIAPNPAAVGIHNYANQLIKEEHVEFYLFWEGLKRYWARALLLFAISLFGFVLLIGNAVFYLNNENQILRLVGLLWIYATYVWLSMQIYILPLLIEQETKSVKYILRNAALLALDNPLVTFTLVLLFLVLTGVSLGLPILVTLVSGSLIGVIQHRAVLTLLEKYRGRTREASGSRESTK